MGVFYQQYHSLQQEKWDVTLDLRTLFCYNIKNHIFLIIFSKLFSEKTKQQTAKIMKANKEHIQKISVFINAVVDEIVDEKVCSQFLSHQRNTNLTLGIQRIL